MSGAFDTDWYAPKVDQPQRVNPMELDIAEETGMDFRPTSFVPEVQEVVVVIEEDDDPKDSAQETVVVTHPSAAPPISAPPDNPESLISSETLPVLLTGEGPSQEELDF